MGITPRKRYSKPWAKKRIAIRWLGSGRYTRLKVCGSRPPLKAYTWGLKRQPSNKKMRCGGISERWASEALGSE